MIMERQETLNDDFWRTCVDNDVSNGWTATVEMEALKITLIKSMFQELGLPIILILNPY